MQISPSRRRGEAESAYFFRYAWFSLKCAVPLGLGLLLLLALRPDATRSPAPLLVMAMYVGLPIGTGMALLAALGFGIRGVLARAFDERADAGDAAEEPLLPLAAPPRSSRWLWAILASLWLIGFLVAVFAPDNILDVPLARAYASFMSPVANPKGLLGTRSQFPQVTLLYHCIAIWSVPLLLVLGWRRLDGKVGRDETSILFRRRLSVAHRLYLIVLVPLWLALAYAALALNHGGDTRLVAFGSSRLQLGLFGLAFDAAAAAMLLAAAFSIRRVFAGYRARGISS